MTMKKYVLIGGYIGSSFIPATTLVHCYGLKREECLLADSEVMLRGHQIQGKIVLRPRPDRDYKEILAVVSMAPIGEVSCLES